MYGGTDPFKGDKMKVTNPNGVPQAMVEAVTPDQDRGLDPARLSITDLINPPIMRLLRHRHWHEMEETVDSRVWLLLGVAVHEYLDRHTPGASEVKMEVKYDKYMLVGVADIIEGSTIADYKVTSVFSFLLGEKIEWEQQLNCYAWMLKKVADRDGADFPINKLKIVAILRDHKPSLALRDHEYPQSAILQKEIRLWSKEEQDSFIIDRVEAHHRASMGVVDPCTPAERYHKDDKYAVKVEGNIRAKRVLDTQEDAENWVKEYNSKMSMKKKSPEKLVIEFRPGEDTRCLRFCPVRNFCEFNRYLGQPAPEDDGEV